MCDCGSPWVGPGLRRWADGACGRSAAACPVGRALRYPPCLPPLAARPTPRCHPPETTLECGPGRLPSGHASRGGTSWNRSPFGRVIGARMVGGGAKDGGPTYRRDFELAHRLTRRPPDRPESALAVPVSSGRCGLFIALNWSSNTNKNWGRKIRFSVSYQHVVNH